MRAPQLEALEVPHRVRGLRRGASESWNWNSRTLGFCGACGGNWRPRTSSLARAASGSADRRPVDDSEVKSRALMPSARRGASATTARLHNDHILMGEQLRHSRVLLKTEYLFKMINGNKIIDYIPMEGQPSRAGW
ncbi:unnamed protein product [Prorocentrum cordatum]|uniref:Uncharacterized protein n=1 Tax=Prorocentrum cordatum TaxID=2364126 RepID=A0ABN9U8V8_9DINO|nr:unnamed protein product [Polarella glacialis]